MSYRDALKVFKLERELGDDEMAFLNTLRRMTEAERDLLVSSLSPTPQKKASKKTNKGASKSAHASSLQAQIQSTTKISGSYTDENGCIYRFTENGGKFCGSTQDSAIHDPAGGYSGYHPYEPPTAQTATTGD